MVEKPGLGKYFVLRIDIFKFVSWLCIIKNKEFVLTSSNYFSRKFEHVKSLIFANKNISRFNSKNAIFSF